MNRAQRALHSRFDRDALDQLRAEVSRLSAELEAATDRAERAEFDAESWHAIAMDLLHADDGSIGITPAGDIGVVDTPAFLRPQAT